MRDDEEDEEEEEEDDDEAWEKRKITFQRRIARRAGSCGRPRKPPGAENINAQIRRTFQDAMEHIRNVIQTLYATKRGAHLSPLWRFPLRAPPCPPEGAAVRSHFGANYPDLLQPLHGAGRETMPTGAAMFVPG